MKFCCQLQDMQCDYRQMDVCDVSGVTVNNECKWTQDYYEGTLHVFPS